VRVYVLALGERVFPTSTPSRASMCARREHIVAARTARLLRAFPCIRWLLSSGCVLQDRRGSAQRGGAGRRRRRIH
jgi:hypothetical protein